MAITDTPERAPRPAKQPKAHQSKVHDIRLHLNIAEHDLGVKLAAVQKFLAKRDQVRVTVQLRGRERGRPQGGVDLLNDFIERVGEVGAPASPPKIAVPNVVVTFNPKKR